MAKIPDEPKKVQFKKGTLSFAGNGPNSRSCHVFIAMEPHGLSLGNALHETPLGEITDNVEVLDRIAENFQNAGYHIAHQVDRSEHCLLVLKGYWGKILKVCMCRKK